MGMEREFSVGRDFDNAEDPFLTTRLITVQEFFTPNRA